MDLLTLTKKARSCRRFDQSKKIDQTVLESIVEVARNMPSAGNIQPLRYCIITNDDVCEKLEEQLAWAGYLSQWDGPNEGEKPSAYIVLLRDTRLPQIKHYDEGSSLFAIQLAATEHNLGACCFASFKKEETENLLQLDEQYEVALVIALGYPKETIILEDIGTKATEVQDAHKYYRDEHDYHHVPKRPFHEVLIKTI